MICGDLGGTNGRLQLWEYQSDNNLDPILKFNFSYRIIEFSSLIELLQKFIVDAEISVDKVNLLQKNLFSLLFIFCLLVVFSDLFEIRAITLAICGPLSEDGSEVIFQNVLCEKTNQRWGKHTTMEVEQIFKMKVENCLFFFFFFSSTLTRRNNFFIDLPLIF